ncbi:PaaX family transcriptional regulator C-terminal domain-containing protein [Roseibium sp.]|uniref:PaaX family transcriptional regulator C-terminal domain-containing protein n=1 Tax=Roseibium sp. TaxID=1936156 RepID=UPI003BAF9D55
MLDIRDTSANHFLRPLPPKAAQLIVTIYGDIVEPRGGVLWMGDLITLCADFGVNESLVRTAVSRLVSKGQLKGEREGRRSFYGLTAAARKEYHLAADLFFGPAEADCDWILTLCTSAAEQSELLGNGFVQISGNMFMAANRPDRPHLGLPFRASVLADETESLRELAFQAFRLDDLARDYALFSETFLEMRRLVSKTVPPKTALQYRLALVHAYRYIKLRDPRLPKAVLPDDWPGIAARTLFADLYRQLSVPADAFIGEHLFDRNGPLPVQPDAVRKRLETLSATS